LEQAKAALWFSLWSLPLALPSIYPQKVLAVSYSTSTRTPTTVQLGTGYT
jgi:energy-converting hydrogenase Eha subunit A